MPSNRRGFMGRIGVGTAAVLTALVGAAIVANTIELTGDIILNEQADHSETPTAGKVQIWAKNTTPAELWMTSDDGTDTQLGAGGSSDPLVLADRAAPTVSADTGQCWADSTSKSISCSYGAGGEVVEVVDDAGHMGLPNGSRLYLDTDQDTYVKSNGDDKIEMWNGGSRYVAMGGGSAYKVNFYEGVYLEDFLTADEAAAPTLTGDKGYLWVEDGGGVGQGDIKIQQGDAASATILADENGDMTLAGNLDLNDQKILTFNKNDGDNTYMGWNASNQLITYVSGTWVQNFTSTTVASRVQHNFLGNTHFYETTCPTGSGNRANLCAEDNGGITELRAHTGGSGHTKETVIVDESGHFKPAGGYGSPDGAVTLGAAATTFAAATSFVTVTGDAGANTVATITGGFAGMRLTLVFVDALVTITDDNTHAADSVDLSAAFTSADDTVLELIYDGTSWYEISRSAN